MQHRTMMPGIALTVALAGGWVTAAARGSDSATAARIAEVAPPAAGVSYTLVEGAGKPLPVQVEKEWRCREDVTAGSLTLGDDGRWLLATATREICGDRTKEDRDTDDGVYRAEGDSIRFLDDDGRKDTGREWGIGSDLDLDELDTGVRSGDGTLRVRLADGRTTLVFRR